MGLLFSPAGEVARGRSYYIAYNETKTVNLKENIMSLFDISPAAAITVALVRKNRERKYNKMIAASQAKLAETTPVSYTTIYA